MAKANSQQIILASNDAQLRERLISLAPQLGVRNPAYWVDLHMHEIVGEELPDGAGTTTVATVLEYAHLVYKPTPLPGANMAAVTDDHIRAALQRVRDREQNGS